MLVPKRANQISTHYGTKYQDPTWFGRNLVRTWDGWNLVINHEIFIILPSCFKLCYGTFLIISGWSRGKIVAVRSAQADHFWNVKATKPRQWQPLLYHQHPSGAKRLNPNSSPLQNQSYDSHVPSGDFVVVQRLQIWSLIMSRWGWGLVH